MGVRPHVVIVGAGFGGLAAARGLDKLAVEVTLIDRQNFTTFQPLLYQVATSGLNATDVAHPVRGLFHRQHNLHVRRGEVVGIDRKRKVVCLADRREGAYDHLILATGAVATWFGAPGAAENAIPLYTLEDAVRLRNHVIERFEVADADPTVVEDGELTFVVVGGGPTGVETAGALAELFSVVFRADYPTIPLPRARVILAGAAGTRRSRRSRPTTSASPPARSCPRGRSSGPRACGPTRWPRPWACRQPAAGGSRWAPTWPCPATRASGPSATWPRPRRTAAGEPCPSSRRWRCSRASTWRPRSAGCSRASPPSRSGSGTRARWPPSAGARRWPSSLGTSTCAAPRPGSPGWACTCCTWRGCATGRRSCSTGCGAT